uniref:Uncharacterized protein n=1 Tax=Setaria digitata TaxID=48799 RepID=A0A915PGT1_9BILA
MKVTASVAPLKQGMDLSLQDDTEKFGRNDKVDKSAQCIVASIFKMFQCLDYTHVFLSVKLLLSAGGESFSGQLLLDYCLGMPDIFKLSAGEARSRLVSRKKDPRRDTQMSLKEKYKLVSNM